VLYLEPLARAGALARLSRLDHRTVAVAQEHQARHRVQGPWRDQVQGAPLIRRSFSVV
jgi:hypothetical protein